MRSVPSSLERIWRSGDYIGDQRPVVRVTVQHPQMRKQTPVMASRSKEINSTGGSGIKSILQHVWFPGTVAYGRASVYAARQWPDKSLVIDEAAGEQGYITFVDPGNLDTSGDVLQLFDEGTTTPLDPAQTTLAAAAEPAVVYTGAVSWEQPPRGDQSNITAPDTRLTNWPIKADDNFPASMLLYINFGDLNAKIINGRVYTTTQLTDAAVVADRVPRSGSYGFDPRSGRALTAPPSPDENLTDSSPFTVEQTYTNFFLQPDSLPVELNNVKGVTWQRSIDTPVASMTLSVYNSNPGASATGRLDQPGFYNANRGQSSFAQQRWSHGANPFNGLLAPDNIIRTYEGYGSDRSIPPERDPHLVQTGVWIINSVTVTTDGLMSVQCSDIGRILQDQMVFPPVIPKDFYPLTFDKGEITLETLKPAVYSPPAARILLGNGATSDLIAGRRYEGSNNPSFPIDHGIPIPIANEHGNVPAKMLDETPNTGWESTGLTRDQWRMQQGGRRKTDFQGNPLNPSTSINRGLYINDTDIWEWVEFTNPDPLNPPETIECDVWSYNSNPSAVTPPQIRYNWTDLWQEWGNPRSTERIYGNYGYLDTRDKYSTEWFGVPRYTNRDDKWVYDVPFWDALYRGQNIFPQAAVPTGSPLYTSNDIQIKKLMRNVLRAWVTNYTLVGAWDFNYTSVTGDAAAAYYTPPIVVGSFTAPNGATIYIHRFRVNAGRLSVPNQSDDPAEVKKNPTVVVRPLTGLKSFRIYTQERIPDINRDYQPDRYHPENDARGYDYPYSRRAYIGGVRAGQAGGDNLVTAAVTREIPSPEGQNPGWYSNYTNIVKLLCAWGGFTWPKDSWQYHTDGRKVPITFTKPDEAVLGKGPSPVRVWGDFQTTAAAGDNILDVDVWDKKSLLDGIQYCRDIVGAIFKIDESGAAVFRLANLYQPGNWLTLNDTPGFTSGMYVLDEQSNLMNLSATTSSANVREGVFVSDGSGEKAAIAGGYNPNPTGLRRWAGWTDSGFETTAEMQRMADMITIRQLMTYRQDSATIPGFPAIQIDDQVRIVEETTGESFIHYVSGINSTLDLEEGSYTYELTTHWLGDSPNAIAVVPRAPSSLPATVILQPTTTPYPVPSITPLPRVTDSTKASTSQNIINNRVMSTSKGSFTLLSQPVSTNDTLPVATDSTPTNTTTTQVNPLWAFSIADFSDFTQGAITQWLQPENFDWEPRGGSA